MNLASLLRDAARRRPAKPALAYGPTHVAGTIDFATFDQEADRVAAALVRWGIEPGDRVAIAMGNVPQFPYSYFGILRAGAVVVPLNALLTEQEAARVLQDSGARVVLGAGAFGDVAARAAAEVASVERVERPERWDDLGPPEAVDRDRGADDLAVLAYTSGTTGRPKGAMLTHGNLLANLEQQMAIPDAHVTEDDVLLLALPLFHIFGLNVTLGLLVMNGATGVLLERFEPIESLRVIEEQKVTIVFGAPPMYVAWVNTPGAEQYDLASVRLAISGAAPLAQQTLDAFRQIFGIDIYEGYGLTETAPTLTSNRMAGDPRPGSVGLPLRGVEIRLVDENGNDVELGDPGEIVVRGPNVFKGYWNQPEATRAAFVDGWFRTGDIAVRDEDAYYFLVDRKKDLIIVSGFNVYPSEVEEALVRHPKVAEAAVIGVPHPYTGEAIKAYVVVAPGAEATPREILDDVSEDLARFKRPEFLEIVETLPHLVTGKVARRELR